MRLLKCMHERKECEANDATMSRNMDMVQARAVIGGKSERREMACPGNSPGVVEAGGSNHAGTRGRRPVPCMASIACAEGEVSGLLS